MAGCQRPVRWVPVVWVPPGAWPCMPHRDTCGAWSAQRLNACRVEVTCTRRVVGKPAPAAAAEAVMLRACRLLNFQ
jgi:hypothetical protein